MLPKCLIGKTHKNNAQLTKEKNKEQINMSTNNIHFSSLSKTKAFRLAFVVLSHRGTIPLYPNGCGILFFQFATNLG